MLLREIRTQNACCEFLQTLIMYHFKTRTKSINCCKMGLCESKSTHCTHIFHSRLHKLPYYKPKPTGVSNIFRRNTNTTSTLKPIVTLLRAVTAEENQVPHLCTKQGSDKGNCVVFCEIPWTVPGT